MKSTGKNDQTSTPISCHQFDIRKFNIEKIERNDIVKSQLSGFIKYDGKPLFLQTDEFELTSYGPVTVNDFNKEWLKESDRFTIKFPLDNQPGCDSVRNKVFTPIDNKLKSKNGLIPSHLITEFEYEDENTDGKKVQVGFKYNPIIANPMKLTGAKKKNRDDAWLKKNPGKKIEDMPPKPQYWKAKLDVDNNTKKIKTVVWVKSIDDGKLTKITPHDVDELANIVTWGSKIRLIVQPSRFWAQMAPFPPTNQSLQYAITWKIKMIECTPRGKFGKAQLDEYAFVNPNENELNNMVPKPEIEEKPKSEVAEKPKVIENESKEPGVDDDGADSVETTGSGETASSEEEKPVIPVTKPVVVTKPAVNTGKKIIKKTT